MAQDVRAHCPSVRSYLAAPRPRPIRPARPDPRRTSRTDAPEKENMKEMSICDAARFWTPDRAANRPVREHVSCRIGRASHRTPVPAASPKWMGTERSDQSRLDPYGEAPHLPKCLQWLWKRSVARWATGAEGATAPEPLRQTDRSSKDTLESGGAMLVPPTEDDKARTCRMQGRRRA